MPKRVAVLVAVTAVAAATVIVAVIQFSSQNQVVQAPVTALHGGSVALDGARLSVPPGAVRGDGHLVASTGGAPQANGAVDGEPTLLAGVSGPVHFSVTGTQVLAALTVTFKVPPGAVPAVLPRSGIASTVWLSFYNPATRHWQAVASTYDHASSTVTARVWHLSWWMPWSWDWAGMTLRLRQALSAFDSGRAPASSCPPVSGVTVTSAGGQDPPLIGCAVKAGPDSLTVTVTNNRGLSMVMSDVPADAVPAGSSYRGFAEYVATRDALSRVLGGAYVPPGETLTYTLPLHGDTAIFTAMPTVYSYVLDLALAAGDALSAKITHDYANCILDAIARSDPASIADAPKLVVSCLHVLEQASPAFQDLIKAIPRKARIVIQLAFFDLQRLLQDSDYIYDAARGVRGNVSVSRPIPDLSAMTWKAVTVPLPANAPLSPAEGANMYLGGVACPTAASCLVVGSYADRNLNLHGLIETLVHGSWTAAEAPLPSDAAGQPQVALGGVACPAVGNCVAVGYYADQNGQEQGLIETLSQGTWTPSQAPGGISLNAVSCAAPGTCLAVGSDISNQPAFETLSRGTWHASAAPLPGSAGRSVLEAVACPVVGSCVATGGYGVADSGQGQGLIETQSHGIWTASLAPLPAGATNRYVQLPSVACPAPDACIAAGSYDWSVAGPGTRPLIETLAHGTWTPSAAPSPPRASSVDELDGVACPAVGVCVATGTYNYTPQGITAATLPWTETLLHGAWSPGASVPISGGPGGLHAVACTATGNCVAVVGHNHPFVATVEIGQPRR